jgi:hypothetical protein
VFANEAGVIGRTLISGDAHCCDSSVTLVTTNYFGKLISTIVL